MRRPSLCIGILAFLFVGCGIVIEESARPQVMSSLGDGEAVIDGTLVWFNADWETPDPRVFALYTWPEAHPLSGTTQVIIRRSSSEIRITPLLPLEPRWYALAIADQDVFSIGGLPGIRTSLGETWRIWGQPTPQLTSVALWDATDEVVLDFTNGTRPFLTGATVRVEHGTSICVPVSCCGGQQVVPCPGIRHDQLVRVFVEGHDRVSGEPRPIIDTTITFAHETRTGSGWIVEMPARQGPPPEVPMELCLDEDCGG